MAEIVNLRLVRKARKRGAAEREAAANRAKHGQTKDDRMRIEQETARKERVIEGHRRETDPNDGA